MVRLEYLSIADTKTLEELSEIEESALVLLSARVGNARLIDNILLGLEPADLAR
jgi:pantothenate synthetase